MVGICNASLQSSSRDGSACALAGLYPCTRHPGKRDNECSGFETFAKTTAELELPTKVNEMIAKKVTSVPWPAWQAVLSLLQVACTDCGLTTPSNWIGCCAREL